MPEPAGSAPGETAPLLQTVQRAETGDRDSTTICVSPEISHSQSSRNLNTDASSADNAASCSSSSPVLGTCRICFETETADSQDPSNPLICPCMCSGSSKYVHRQCLSQWRTTNHRADAFYQCEVCKYRWVWHRQMLGCLCHHVGTAILASCMQQSGTELTSPITLVSDTPAWADAVTQAAATLLA